MKKILCFLILLSALQIGHTQYRSTIDMHNRDQIDESAVQEIERCDDKTNELEKEYNNLQKKIRKILEEYKQGRFCSLCNRTPSEIERELNIPFETHVKNVGGKVVSSQEKYNRKKEELNRKLDNLKNKMDRSRERCQGLFDRAEERKQRAREKAAEKIKQEKEEKKRQREEQKRQEEENKKKEEEEKEMQEQMEEEKEKNQEEKEKNQEEKENERESEEARRKNEEAEAAAAQERFENYMNARMNVEKQARIRDQEIKDHYQSERSNIRHETYQNMHAVDLLENEAQKLSAYELDEMEIELDELQEFTDQEIKTEDEILDQILELEQRKEEINKLLEEHEDNAYKGYVITGTLEMIKAGSDVISEGISYISGGNKNPIVATTNRIRKTAYSSVEMVQALKQGDHEEALLIYAKELAKETEDEDFQLLVNTAKTLQNKAGYEETAKEILTHLSKYEGWESVNVYLKSEKALKDFQKGADTIIEYQDELTRIKQMSAEQKAKINYDIQKLKRELGN